MKTLRYYQNDARQAAEAVLVDRGRALLVLATGLGKSSIISELVQRWKHGNVLALAHRDELVFQLRDELEQRTGINVGVEKAESLTHPGTLITVGSIQSFNKRRLERLGRDRYSLIVIDECHHAASPTYLRLIEWFNSAAVLGVTATPDRGDKKSLGSIFDSIDFEMGIREGIDEGYLVPIKCWSVYLDSIDISGVSTRAGDLADGMLDLAMLRAVEGIVRKSIEIGGERQGIAFFPGVRSAELANERFNALQPDSSVFISAKTPDTERRESIARFRAGDVRYLCNVGIANEGFDAPRTSLIIQGAPTLSRPVYAQRIGRGTRVLPGTVDGFADKSQARERRDAVARSAKHDCLVLDFVGNCGKHSLVTPVDVLAGNSYSEEEKQLAKKKQLAQPGTDARKLLEQSREELKRIAQSMGSKVGHSIVEVDPFDPFAIMHLKHENTVGSNYRPLSAAQRTALIRCGVEECHVDSLDGGKGARLLSAMAARRARGLASFGQLKTLQRFGVDQINISFNTAKSVLDYIAGTSWGKRSPISKTHIDTLLGTKK